VSPGAPETHMPQRERTLREKGGSIGSKKSDKILVHVLRKRDIAPPEKREKKPKTVRWGCADAAETWDSTEKQIWSKEGG